METHCDERVVNFWQIIYFYCIAKLIREQGTDCDGLIADMQTMAL